MPLSVERLKGLVTIMEFGNAIIMREASEDVAEAIRELIAIKEAKPVAYECDGALTQHPFNYPGHVSVPLIRKPE